MDRPAIAIPLRMEEWQKRFGAENYWHQKRFPHTGARFSRELGLGTFEIEGRFFGMRARENLKGELFVPGQGALGAFVSELNAAARRLSGIVSSDRWSFPVTIQTGQQNMSSDFGDSIHVGDCYVRGLSSASERGDYTAVASCIQSEFFHELIHNFRASEPHEDYRELLPLLGEFIYDPANNAYRNDVFRKMGEEARQAILEQGKMDSPKMLFGRPAYENEWLALSKVLVWEYSRIDENFSVPQTLEGQLAVVVELPGPYKTVPQEARDAILRKYLTRPCEEIERLLAEYGKELGLKY